MRLSDLFQSNPFPTPQQPRSVLDQVLPPNPEPPSRPTIPSPTCGTLPPLGTSHK